jgi:uncharacterized protein YuzE
MSNRFEFAHEPRLGLGYLYLNDGAVTKTVEVANGVSVDVAEDGTVIGVELLNLRREEPPMDATRVRDLIRLEVAAAERYDDE